MLPDKTGVLLPGNCLSDSLLFSVFFVHTWLLECFHNPLNYGMDPVFNMWIFFFLMCIHIDTAVYGLLRRLMVGSAQNLTPEKLLGGCVA